MIPITRQYYADKLDAWIGKGQIIVLIGQRRIGKSYILKDFMVRHKGETGANFIYINKERQQFDDLRNNVQLNAYIDAHRKEGLHNFILIDEVKEIEGWEKSVRSYRLEEDTDVIITGSNSKMLSGELSSLIGGRYQEIYVQSLSYKEFIIFHGLNEDNEALWKYLNYGGLRPPKLVRQPHERVYVQVAYLIASPEAEEREFGCLDNIKDNYPKYVISMTPMVKQSDRRGITHLGLREFLINGF